jgi:hypothetical protein
MLEEGINDFDEQSIKFISSEVYRNDNDNQLPLAA